MRRPEAKHSAGRRRHRRHSIKELVAAAAEGPRQKRVRDRPEQLKEGVFQTQGVQQGISRPFVIAPEQQRWLTVAYVHGETWWLPGLKRRREAIRSASNDILPAHSQTDAATDVCLLPFLLDLLPSPYREQLDAEQQAHLDGLSNADPVGARKVVTLKISQAREPVLSVNEPWQ
ncbi:hypothetical protein ACVB8X_33225 [Streptomyces sp. NRAIS4]